MKTLKGILLALSLLVGVQLLKARWEDPFAAWRGSKYVSADGYVTRLVRWEYGTNRVLHIVPSGIWDKAHLVNLTRESRESYAHSGRTFLGRGLPEHVPGERCLTCVFWVGPETKTAAMEQFRVVTRDESGNEFDPGSPNAGLLASDPRYWAAELWAIPRRGEFVDILIKRGTNLFGEFRIPNPAAGNNSEWKAAQAPIAASTNGVDIVLSKFSTRHSSTDKKFAFTKFAFQFRKDGRVLTNWMPLSAEMEDATGNHCRYEVEEFGTAVPVVNTEGVIEFGFPGGLAKNEKAWKLTVEWKQTGDFEEADLITLETDIPKRYETLRPQKSWQGEGWKLNLTALLGVLARDEEVKGFAMAHRNSYGISMALSGKITGSRRDLVMVSLGFDGVTYPEAHGSVTEAIWKEDSEWRSYLVQLPPPESEKKMKIVMSVPKRLKIEFLAAPAMEID